jgi:MFS family permease
VRGSSSGILYHVDTAAAVPRALIAPAAHARRTVLVLVALWTFTGAAYGFVMPFLTVYAAGRGLTLTGIGIMGAIVAAGCALAQPVVGRLVDRTGLRRAAMFGSTVIGAAGFTGLGYAAAAWLIVLFALLGTIGFYGSRVVITATTVDLVERGGHGVSMYARFRICPAIGFLVTAVLGGFLLGHVSFSVLFTAGALFYLLAGACGLALPAGVTHTGPPLIRDAGSAPLISPRRALLALSLMSLLFYVVSSTSDTYVPLLMRTLHGSFVEVGLVGTIGAIAEVPLMMLVGRMADRGSSALVLAIGLCAVPLRYLLYLVVHTPVQLMAVQCLDAVSFSAYAVAGVTLLARLTPPKERGFALGMYSSAGTLGPIPGPLLGGVLAAAIGIQAMLGLVTIVAIAVPLTVIVGLRPLLVRRPRGRHL